MRYRRLGRDGPEASAVCFGTWAAGGMWGETDDQEIVRAMRIARERCGVNFFDTADAYGWGRAEELIGEAFGGDRDEVVIATKVGITRRGIVLAPRHIRAACEASLRRLRTDRIDLYQIHWPEDPDTPLEESWEAMARLVDDGKVRHIGVSNFGIDDLGTCEKVRHVASVQNEYSMLTREPEDEVLPWCGERGTGYLSYGSLAYGILSGKYTPESRFSPQDWRSGAYGLEYYERLFAPPVFAAHLARVARLRPVAQDAGLTLAQLAVAWILRQPSVTAAICGARRPEQIADTAAAGDVDLDDSAARRIEEILRA